MAPEAQNTNTKKRKATTEAATNHPKRQRSPPVTTENGDRSELASICDQIQTQLKLYKEAGSLQDQKNAINSLVLMFSRLLAEGQIHPQTTSSVGNVVAKWLLERYEEFRGLLLGNFMNAPHLQGDNALHVLMRLFKQEVGAVDSASHLSWTKSYFVSIIQTLLRRRVDEGSGLAFGKHYVRKYREIKSFFFSAAKRIMGIGVESLDPGEVASRLIDIFLVGDITPEDDQDATFLHDSPPKKVVAMVEGRTNGKDAAEVWTSIMKGTMSKHLRKRILQAIPHHVVPWFPRKEALMDFLSDSFDAGGSTSLMALAGLLNLIQEKGLDYPQLYTKLYSQLDCHTLHSKHRSRFLRLLQRALGSSHLPAALVASFIKRMSRLCLFAPPSAIVAIIPWVYNLLKAHQACRFLVHRATRAGETSSSEEKETTDPFNMNERDPMESNAIDSSLWELETLQSHYHPNVSAIASIISQQFLKQTYNLEDFLDHTYGSVSCSPLADRVSANHACLDDGSRAIEGPDQNTCR